MRDDKRMPRSEQIEEAVLDRIRAELRPIGHAKPRKPTIWTVGLVAAAGVIVGGFFILVNVSDSVSPCVDLAVSASPTPTPSSSGPIVIGGETAIDQRCQPRP